MRLHTEPSTEWKNIFQLWRHNGEVLPFRVVRSSWSADAPHFLVVEEIEIRNWPYGTAWGSWHYAGQPPKREKIGVAGTYVWRLMGPSDPGW